MRGRRRVRVDSAAKDAAASPAASHSRGSGVASSPPAARRRLSVRRFARVQRVDTMEWERNNTVRLIELIRARPCLWDASSRRYTERHCRRDALADVARTLGVSLLCVQKKWTNLRTQYFRERARVHTIPGHSPRWFGFNMMRFLEDGPINQHPRSSTIGSSGMVVEVVDEDSRADSCWATSSSVECGNSSRDPDEVEIVIEQAPCIKRQVKDPFDEEVDDEETRSQPPTPTPQIELTMPPVTPPPPPPREATPPPTPPPQKKTRAAAKQQQQPAQPQPQPSTSGAALRQPQAEATPQPRPPQPQPQPHSHAEPPRPPLLLGRTVPPPTATDELQRDYSPPPAAAVRGTKRRVEVVDPLTMPSTSTATSSFPVVTEPPEEVHATLHDRLDMYALHVASRLRQIQDPYYRMVAINRIDNALFNATSSDLLRQRHSAPAAPVHSSVPPTGSATAANSHYPAANPHSAFPGIHVMGTYHQAPSVQPDHPRNTWDPEVLDVLESKNFFVDSLS